jgi:hypothetical protein
MYGKESEFNDVRCSLVADIVCSVFAERQYSKIPQKKEARRNNGSTRTSIGSEP